MNSVVRISAFFIYANNIGPDQPTQQGLHCLVPGPYDPLGEKTVFFCICENKDTHQLRGNREADQRLCFHYSDSTIPLLPTSEISSL